MKIKTILRSTTIKQTKLNLVILDRFMTSKLFSLEVQLGSSLIDPVLLQEET
jgi:hypothetical protein